MTKTIDHIQENLSSDVFSDVELLHLFPESHDRRYSLIKRSMAHGEILHLRRGLYCFAEKYRRRSLHLLELAQNIYGPSYISLESALSYHGLIPEAVHTITAASHKRSRKFQTPLGNFDFFCIHSKPFLAGVYRECTEQHAFYMASALRALADYVYIYKKNWNGLHPLIHSLRIEEDMLHGLGEEQFM